MTDDERDFIIEECAKCIPTNWCDSLLTGPTKVIPNNTNGQVIEALLRAVAERIRSLKSEQGK